MLCQFVIVARCASKTWWMGRVGGLNGDRDRAAMDCCLMEVKADARALQSVK